MAKEFFRDVFAVMLVLLLIVAVCMTGLNWFTPPVTMFQLTDPSDSETVSQTVSLDHVDRDFLAAVLLHEDAQLGHRTGPFDIGQFLERVRIHRSGGDDPSGSTIPQQIVKNLVFTRDQNAFRKGIEAVLSFPFNAVLSDRRQLELYVNLAQFAPDLYGVCSASWYYFNTPPWDIDGAH
ncbi:transglycosylase domain-containing protein (plasmid) [Rhodococcus pyridinivorans]|uniref:transglycosylase domain-containing protein n=1 Tax=Rhodococcus pyridinivorans TaxID=103816 RepID=UPI002164BFC1|nr:transglycosylase domain-containing protein [Rhodococcus pyridinivorans]UVT27724.1 transglycosylase domain-containing protein [Rhodococcus pyridinivorans]